MLKMLLRFGCDYCLGDSGATSFSAGVIAPVSSSKELLQVVEMRVG